MSVDRSISVAIVEAELLACKSLAERYGWLISEIDKENLKFTVSMQALDKERYHLEITFDDYREIPLFIEFFDATTGEKGIHKVYPKSRDSFFHHSLPCICNPFSRKSYKQFDDKAPHGDWNMADWQSNVQLKNLKDLPNILSAIYFRMNNPEKYDGRMA